MKRFLASMALLLPVAVAPDAFAASSNWFSAEGGDLRLVTSADQSEPGLLKGALEIVLKPGWKTYWVDPGDAGVPPQIDVSASRDVSGARILFPAPQRFQDEYAVWAGYKNHVSLAVEFDVGEAPQLEADVFLGLCEKICIPVQVKFSLDPHVANDSSEHARTVATAFAGLPAPPGENFQLRALRVAGEEMLRAEIVLPEESGETELFLASADGWYFGTPAKSEDGTTFDIPVLLKPKDRVDGGTFFYTLTAGGKAVSGAVPIILPETD